MANENNLSSICLFVLRLALGVGACLASAVSPIQAAAPETSSLPNFIIIFTDDQGYQDLGCFGSPNIQTPCIDRMAREGMRFTNFYAQTVCGPSRAALMTGSYPLRVAKRNNQLDIHPYLHTQEVTIAEVLKRGGYATGCFGKWDLAGHTQTRYDKNLLPTRQGFDTFFGTPTSNDSIVNLMRNEEVIEQKANMDSLTRRYTDEALNFIRKHRQGPFFVYIPYTMPHTRLAASVQFRGKSRRGLYGDVIEEIDWNVGRILTCAKELGLGNQTFVIFTSDNGPWWKKKDQGGSALPLRGAKTSSWEGGLRVPCIMWAPGRIPAGAVCHEITCTMDLLPTLAGLAGAEIPRDRVIDGQDISAWLHGGTKAKAAARVFYYYVHTHLQAVRAGRWKLHLARSAEPPWCPKWASHIDSGDVIDIPTPMLFDLETDIGETIDVAQAHPEIVKQLLDLADWARKDIGDYDRMGLNARFFDAQPRRPDVAKWLDQQDSVYLFTSFRGNGEDGLHLAYSQDGLKWTALKQDKPFVAPQVGGKLMRDPCIIQGPDGIFHMVWTTSWTDQGIGIAHSADLITWSEQKFIPVMGHEAQARNCWAPEITWDLEGKQYVIYWATTLPDCFPETAKNADRGWNHRIYCTTTKDFQTYTITKLFYEPGFNVIDSTITRHQGQYVMILKDETRFPPAKNLRVAHSPRVTGPWGPASDPFTLPGLWVEGPTVLKAGQWYTVYYDAYRKHRYGAMRTRDFKTWEDISDKLSFPPDTRHGTILPVSQDVLKRLMQEK